MNYSKKGVTLEKLIYKRYFFLIQKYRQYGQGTTFEHN